MTGKERKPGAAAMLLELSREGFTCEVEDGARDALFVRVVLLEGPLREPTRAGTFGIWASGPDTGALLYAEGVAEDAARRLGVKYRPADPTQAAHNEALRARARRERNRVSDYARAMEEAAVEPPMVIR